MQSFFIPSLRLIKLLRLCKKPSIFQPAFDHVTLIALINSINSFNRINHA